MTPESCVRNFCSAPGEVVQRDGAGMGDAEGVDGVAQRHLLEEGAGAGSRDPGKVGVGQQRAVGDSAELVVVGDEGCIR